MRNLIIVFALLASGCTKDGGAFVCYSEDGAFEAEARIDVFSGEIKRYDAIDQNGIGFPIDDDNSLKFDCITKAEDDEREARAAESRKRDCESRKEGDPWKDEFCSTR